MHTEPRAARLFLLASRSPRPGDRCRYPAKHETKKPVRFKLSHLFYLVAISAVVVAFCVNRWTIRYPIENIDSTRRVNQHPQWKFEQSIGDHEGPFRSTGSNYCYGNVECTFTYSNNGSIKKLVIPPNTYGGQDFIVHFFENRKKNHLLQIYKRAE